MLQSLVMLQAVLAQVLLVSCDFAGYFGLGFLFYFVSYQLRCCRQFWLELFYSYVTVSCDVAGSYGWSYVTLKLLSVVMLQAILAGDYILSVLSTVLARIGNPEVVSIMSQVVEDLVRGE